MSLQRRTRLSAVSAKKRAELAGKPAFSTFRPQVVAGKREPRTVASPRRPRATGFPSAVVAIIAQRDGGCVRCGAAIRGERGRDWSTQHRRARGSGGSRRPDTNQPQNGLILCGSATSAGGCHQHVERFRAEARDNGWAIRQADDPLQVPVTHWLHGVVWLTADGGFTSRRPEQVP